MSAPFVVVDIPLAEGRQVGKHDELWAALVANSGRALQFDGATLRDRRNLWQAINARCKKTGRVLRVANRTVVERPFSMWLESTDKAGGDR